ncbi:MAG: hypothetical protein IKN53_07040 [Oscillibacter sp.]|nr:hypothetical protein [Oscillibacter sp.]
MRINVKTINVFSLGCLIALIFIPLLSRYLRVITFYPLLLLWGLSAFLIDNRHAPLRRSGADFLIYVCLLYLAAYAFTGSSGYLRRILTYIIISYSSLLMYAFYERHPEMIDRHKWFVYFCLVVGLFTTIPGLLQYPMASRILATNEAIYAGQQAQFKAMGIGGYEYIYTLVIFVIFSPNALRVAKRKRLYWFIALAMLVCIFLAGYTIAILLSLSMTLISFVVSRRRRQFVLKILIIAFLSILIWSFREPILLAIADFADSQNVYYVSTRIRELLYAEEFGEFSSLERIVLYQNSIRNFLGSPLVGVLSRRPMLYKSGHSEILFYIETFGMLGIPYIGFLYSTFKRYAKGVTDMGLRSCLVCCQVFFFIFAAVNRTDVAYPLMWSVFFVIPFLTRSFERELKAEEAI